MTLGWIVPLLRRTMNEPGSSSSRDSLMRYVMKQKLLAWGDDFTIRDADGNDVFYVDGKAFSLGKQLSFQDMEGRELAYIRQKLLAWGPTYEIERGGVVVAIVKKELFTLFNCRFSVDVPGPDDLEASGNLLHHEYVLTRQGRAVATVTKEWVAWSDTYGIDIADGEDEVLILASAIVIDLCCHRSHRH
jgi:uncharacterized protein YxjI